MAIGGSSLRPKVHSVPAPGWYQLVDSASFKTVLLLLIQATRHQLDVYKEETKCKQNSLVNIKTVFLCLFSGSWEDLKPTLKRRRETSDSEEPQKRTNKLLEAWSLIKFRIVLNFSEQSISGWRFEET